MFSPSLLNAMIHSVWPGDQFSQNEFPDYAALSTELRNVSEPSTGWPLLPVIGQTQDLPDVHGQFSLDDQLDWEEGPGGAHFWKRVSWNSLRDYFCYKGGFEKSAKVEFIDLGAPLSGVSSAASVAARQKCQALFAKSPSGKPKVVVAIVDRGEASNTSPDDFFGRVTHINTSGSIEFDDHAYEVLAVLLDRLAKKQVLSDCEIVCSLVLPPPGQIGMTFFKHANAVELLKEIKALEKHLNGKKLVAAINVSLGCHCGPHNGQSPLESQIRSIRGRNSDRFVVAAAGNDGLTGRSGSIELSAGLADYMQIRTGRAKSDELLVEFWWEESSSATADLELEIDIASRRGVRYPTIYIDKNHRGKTLSASRFQKFPGAPSLAHVSIFRDHCYQDMSCASLALSATNPRELRGLEITIRLVATANIVVNGWVVVSSDCRTGFVAGHNFGTIMVPATVENVISVAGVEQHGHPWARSSRGIAGDYALPRTSVNQAPPLKVAPFLSHLVDPVAGGKKGTSFSSPRVCADLAELIAKNRQPKSADLDKWVAAILNLAGKGPWVWNSRTGMGGLSK